VVHSTGLKTVANSEFVKTFLFQTVDPTNGGGQIVINQDRKDAAKKNPHALMCPSKNVCWCSLE
jgi:hypothetical protein